MIIIFLYEFFFIDLPGKHVGDNKGEVSVLTVEPVQRGRCYQREDHGPVFLLFGPGHTIIATERVKYVQDVSGVVTGLRGRTGVCLGAGAWRLGESNANTSHNFIQFNLPYLFDQTVKARS